MTNFEIKEQVKLYFNTLHVQNQKGGHFVFSPQDKYGEVQDGAIGTCINEVSNLFFANNNTVFVTLNSYKKVSNKNLRNAKNLWGIDCIMIDIDGTPELCGKEEELYNNLSWFWKTKKLLPEPNMYSFTGGGGIHLYYCFDRLPRQMENSVKTLKKLFNEKLKEIQNSYDVFPYVCKKKSIITYNVDCRVVDSQRYDRVPGSINKKTGNRCICFKNNVERYQYLSLFNYFEDDYKKPVRNKNKLVKTSAKPKKQNYSAEILKRLANKRVKALFELQKNGHHFYGCREYAIFVLANSLRQLEYSKTNIKRMLFDFNNGFYEPLSAAEINANVKQNIIYAISNREIITWLKLEPSEEKLFITNKRPGNRKKRTFNNKVNIAKLVVEGFSISQIAKKLNISISIVKHMRAAIKKEGGFLYWSLGCDKKKYKNALKNMFIQKKPMNNRLYCAGLKSAIFSTLIGSFCNKYNILRRNTIESLKEINYSLDYKRYVYTPLLTTGLEGAL